MTSFSDCLVSCEEKHVELSLLQGSNAQFTQSLYIIQVIPFSYTNTVCNGFTIRKTSWQITMLRNIHFCLLRKPAFKKLSVN